MAATAQAKYMQAAISVACAAKQASAGIGI